MEENKLSGIREGRKIQRKEKENEREKRRLTARRNGRINRNRLIKEKRKKLNCENQVRRKEEYREEKKRK
jgi:hypothetical protein